MKMNMMNYMKIYIKVFAIGLKQIKKWIIDEDRIGIVSVLLVSVFYFTHCMIERNDLENNQEMTVGVIYAITTGRDGGYLYRYYVNGVEYHGRASRGISKIRIGDSLYVFYDRTDPSNYARGSYFEYVLDTEQLPDTVYYRRRMNRMRRPME